MTPEQAIDWNIPGREFFDAEEQKRRDFAFRHDVPKQSPESRSNLLKSMFEELEATNVHRDPYLQSENDHEECVPKRGREVIIRNWAPI